MYFFLLVFCSREAFTSLWRHDRPFSWPPHSGCRLLLAKRLILRGEQCFFSTRKQRSKRIIFCLHLQHVLLRGIFVVCVSGIGYAAAISYRLFLRSQRAALLDEPLDILGGKY